MSEQNNNGDTALWFASHEGCESKVRCLLSLGVWPEIPARQPICYRFPSRSSRATQRSHRSFARRSARTEAGGYPPPSTENAAPREHASDPLIGPACTEQPSRSCSMA